MKIMYLLFISMLPFIELRGAIPIGIGFGLPFWEVLFVSIIGNIIPVLPILILFQPISNILLRFKWYRRLYDKVYERTTRKGKKNLDKYGALGLFLFTAIPLPTTGAWSAALLATFFRVRIEYAFLAISFGVVTAGIIMTLISHLVF